MARRPGPDEGQSDLFGLAPREPPTRPAARTRRRADPERRDEAVEAEVPPAPAPAEPAPAVEVTIEELAARLGPAELDALVVALGDERLAALAGTTMRALRRRLRGRGQERRDRGGAALARALAAIAAELREPGED